MHGTSEISGLTKVVIDSTKFGPHFQTKLHANHNIISILKYQLINDTPNHHATGGMEVHMSSGAYEYS